ncbi:cytochrome b5-like [Dysidea avara]|uniref:cytochrome b5-like n=1 Tax=Dysidea avara TaxID=196820 RepID=UPI003329A0E3
MSEQFTREDVAKHNTSESCWIIIHDNVYDVTDFLNDHPGGGDILLEFAGQDATAEFEDNHHSQDARELAKSYLIGFISNQDGSRDQDTSGGQPQDSSWCTIS